MTDFLTALTLAVVLEGLLYALFPDGLKRMMTHVLTVPSGRLRLGGLVAAALGIAALWLIRRV